MRQSFNRTFAPGIAAIAFLAALLLSKWAGAAEVYGEQRIEVCIRKELTQSGRKGETVLVCETVTVKSREEK